MNLAFIKEKFSLIEDYWSPKIIGEMNGQLVKIAKVKGDFIWHDHAQEDELFYIVKGELTLSFRDKVETLKEGDLRIIPRSVEHKPSAEEEVWLMMIEPASTVNTGQAESELTVNTLDRI